MKKLIATLMLLSGTVQAAVTPQTDRLFDIEVLIFKRAVEPQNTLEAWPEDLAEVKLANAHEFDDIEYRQDKGVKMLAIDDYQLTEYRDKLNQHAGYEVLLHKAWQQPDLSRATAPQFLISAGKDYSDKFTPAGLPIDNEELQQAAEDAQELIEQTDEVRVHPATELVGNFKIYINHYLFLETSLDLNVPTVQDVIIVPEAVEPETPTEVDENGNVVQNEPFTDNNQISVLDVEEDQNTQFGGFQEVNPTIITTEVLKAHRFEQRRRMRSGEIHYLDHPLMGIVVQVRRAN